MAGCFKWTVQLPSGSGDPDELLMLALCDLPVSWVLLGDGSATVWIEEARARNAREGLSLAGILLVSEEVEPERDWVEESAGLRKPVAVGGYLLDPHDDARASAAGERRRLYLPAARAFGTGSHESTRLAARLLISSPLEGKRVLDVGCGAGTLAFVAKLEGARDVVALDIDQEAAFAVREHALKNGIRGVRAFAGPARALLPGTLFDAVVANMLRQELSPLLRELCGMLPARGLLLTSGQLEDAEDSWMAELEEAGFVPFRVIKECEWIATAARKAA